VAQITDAQRKARIQELLNEINKMPPERHETMRVHLTTGETLCDVIQLRADEVLLNHRSHRIRSQIEGDPEWEAVKSDPTSEAAQRIVQDRVRHARSDQEFNELRESLVREGQTEPGVMTRDGVLVNANTRAVAMREMDNPDRQNIRVAVLPMTLQPSEIGLLELRLQMQKVLKVEYTLTNHLLFIEELSNERNMTDDAIAREMFPENIKKGALEVPLRLKYLDLIRRMQRIPTKPLRLKDFDVLAREQMRDVYNKYERLQAEDPSQARIYLQSFLLSVLVGVVSVHQIREIDAEFVKSYVIPTLEEDQEYGIHAAKLAEPKVSPENVPKGAKALGGGATSADGDGEPNILGLIDAISGKDNKVNIPGTAVHLEKREVKEAVSFAFATAIKDKKRDEREANRLEAPNEALKTAIREITKANDSLKAALGDPDFDVAHRKSLEASFKRLGRTMRSLEAALLKAGVTGS
jgi:hypothetical protein